MPSIVSVRSGLTTPRPPPPSQSVLLDRHRWNREGAAPMLQRMIQTAVWSWSCPRLSKRTAPTCRGLGCTGKKNLSDVCQMTKLATTVLPLHRRCPQLSAGGMASSFATVQMLQFCPEGATQAQSTLPSLKKNILGKNQTLRMPQSYGSTHAGMKHFKNVKVRVREY